MKQRREWNPVFKAKKYRAEGKEDGLLELTCNRP